MQFSLKKHSPFQEGKWMIVLIGVKICNHPLKICTARLPSRDNTFRIFLRMCIAHEDFMRVRHNMFLISLKICTPREDFTGANIILLPFLSKFVPPVKIWRGVNIIFSHLPQNLYPGTDFTGSKTVILVASSVVHHYAGHRKVQKESHNRNITQECEQPSWCDEKIKLLNPR